MITLMVPPPITDSHFPMARDSVIKYLYFPIFPHLKDRAEDGDYRFLVMVPYIPLHNRYMQITGKSAREGDPKPCRCLYAGSGTSESGDEKS
jgi:hypothetical protein